MKPARCALHGGRRGVLYFCLHISDILSVKKRRGFEQEGTDNGVFSLLPPRPPVPRTIHLRREIDRMNRIYRIRLGPAALVLSFPHPVHPVHPVKNVFFLRLCRPGLSVISCSQFPIREIREIRGSFLFGCGWPRLASPAAKTGPPKHLQKDG